MKFKYDILENTSEGIVKIGEKEVYNLDSVKDDLGKWLRNYTGINKIEINQPNLKSFNSINETGNKNGIKVGYKNMLGSMNFNSIAVYKNQTDVFLMSGVTSLNANIYLFKDNFYKCIAGYCSRRLIEPNVWNDKDEYMKPSDTILASDEYKQWNNDCIIYSLFDNQSFQSSLRQIEYQGKKWDIINEFFWLSPDYMKKLAESINWIEMIDDIDENGQDRFVYTEIERIKSEDITFSKEALDLLSFANQLVENSFKYRKFMHNEREEYHLHSWDCGWAQLKLVYKEYMKEYMKQFLELRKLLADKLRPKVYEFGFLYD